jgi:hypothetical protein
MYLFILQCPSRGLKCTQSALTVLVTISSQHNPRPPTIGKYLIWVFNGCNLILTGCSLAQIANCLQVQCGQRLIRVRTRTLQALISIQAHHCSARGQLANSEHKANSIQHGAGNYTGSCPEYMPLTATRHARAIHVTLFRAS